VQDFIDPSPAGGTRRLRLRGVAGAVLLAGLMAMAPGRAAEPSPWQALAPSMFEHLVPAERGFPSPVTMSIVQDGDGFMWFGTQVGLGRWDGYRMRNFFFNPDDPGSLPSDFVQTLHVDRQGRLWVGTSTDGLAMYDKQTERFIRYPAGPHGLSSPTVGAIASDERGGIWIGTSNGLNYLDTAHGNVISHFPRDASAANGARSNQIRALLVDRAGHLWIGSNGGLARRDAASGRVTDIAGAGDAVLSLTRNGDDGVLFGTLKSGIGLATVDDGAHLLALEQVKDADAAMVLSMTETAPGTWWAATYGGGIIEFDLSGRSRRISHRSAIPTSLANDRAASVWRDRSGLVWVANERGVDIHNPNNRTVETVMDGVGLPEISAFAFMTDSAGRLWVSLGDQGIDLIASDGVRTAGLRPDPSRPESALPNRLILAMAEAEPQEAWIGTAMGLYHTSGHGSSVRRVPLPHADPLPRISSILRWHGDLWLGTPGGLLRYDTAAGTIRVYAQGAPATGGLSDSRITTMLAGPDGALWVATRNGINRIDPATGQIEQINAEPGRAAGLSHGMVNTMAFDAQGRLWAGTNNGGINIVDGYAADGTRRFRRLDLQNGLPSNIIAALRTDQAGRIWAATANGIAVIDAATLKTQALNRAGGLVFQAYIVGAVGQTAQSDIVFGTSGGYVIVHPQRPEPWSYQPPLAVSSVRLDRRAVPAAPLLEPGGASLSIPAGTRQVEIEVAALDFSASQNNRYAFRLDGYDKDWVETDASHRTATYANVSPGHYRLHMRGSNRDGTWSPHQLSMDLHFLPAWYQTWWARLGAVLAALAVGWGLYRWRVRQLRQQVYLRTLHLERVHAIVKSINDELDFDALLHTILRESSTIGAVRAAYALIRTDDDEALAVRASWRHSALPQTHAGMTLAEAQSRLVDAADLIAPDMYLTGQTVLAVRICVEQQVQGYLVFEQETPFARRDLDMFKALKEPFVSAFQKASAISAIQQARADAEASTRAKSDFLANISHEIRTPMNAILGFAGLGTHLDLPPKPRDYFNKIGRAGQNLLGIIDDVLDFAKIESGKLELEAVPFDLADTLGQIADLFSWRAAEKGLELLAWAAPGVPLRLVGDPLRLSQVLVNLLGNALKFTAHGHIGLRVELASAHDDGSELVKLRFVVEDSGVGINAEQQSRLFRAFSQADTSTTRLYGGTGLGLAISQQLVQAMDGVIEIDSTPGEGSRFHFELVLPCQPANAEPAPLPAAARGKQVLIVDDSALMRDMLLRQLGSEGFVADAVDSGAAALAWIASRPADLVLIDWDMPGLSGVDTARSLRREMTVPMVLMVTDFAREPVLAAATQAGVGVCLSKPVNPAHLREAVLAALGLGPPVHTDASPAAAALSDAAQQIAGARVLVVDDNVINQQVAREVLMRAGVQADLAGSGVEALHMVEQTAYDAVLMDIQMPEMDGYEATARIRAQPRHARLPLIAMTAHAVAGFRESSLSMGMNDYVTKPIEPERLFAVLASWVKLDPQRALALPATAATTAAALAAMAASAATAEATPYLPGIDMAAALGRLGGNRKLLATLLDRFVEEFEPTPQRLLAAIEQGAFEQAALIVHKVRGAAGNLSMPELHRSAGELEQLLRAPGSGKLDEPLAAFGAALEQVIDGVQAPGGAALRQSAPVSP
jgi:signal transduction histidine kinase/DNA-binding response OmpR family regulator/ligand-binding sensor domain-containing protein/HPt (histidine-containing phosphotransfer) domain-containing protein